MKRTGFLFQFLFLLAVLTLPSLRPAFAQEIITPTTTIEPIAEPVLYEEFNPWDWTAQTPVHRVGYQSWYQLAATSLGTSADALSQSDKSIATLAREKRVRLNVIKNGIFTVEKKRIQAYLKNSNIGRNAWQTQERTLRANIDTFLNTAPQQMKTDVKTQWTLWSNWNINNYQFTFTQSCFCWGLQPYRVTVKNDVATEVVGIDTGESLSPEVESYQFRTLDDQFQSLYDAEINGAYAIYATYDPVFGFPLTTYIDQNPMMADEEMRYTFSNFQPMK